MFFEFILLFSAGFFGGILNSIAGGGSFITFPALLFVGVPPISANATNTFASCAGYLSGTYAFKQELYNHKKALPQLIFLSIIGGSVGAWLLLKTPESVFREAIPWLLLFAMLLFLFGSHINARLKSLTAQHRHASLTGYYLLAGLLFLICIYGGFFNAGLGIITLSYLALAGYTNIHLMNAMKLLVSSVVSLIAILLFIYDDIIVWQEGITVLFGTLLGGYLAAHVSKKLPQSYVRYFVVIAGTLITIYFFIDTYAT